MIQSADLLNDIVQDLENYEQSIRLKKLMYYACKQHWEDNEKILNHIPLEFYIQELQEEYPNLAGLMDYMSSLVLTLNRAEVYSEVADYLIKKLAIIYGNSDKKILSTNVFIDDSLADRVVENLGNNHEVERIKKLIFATCKGYWESDISVISSYDFRELILYLRQITADLEELRTELYKIVGILNRENLYSFIADTIIREFSILYDDGDKTDAIKPENQNQIIDKNQFLVDNIGNNNYDIFKMRLEIIQYTNPLRAKILLFFTIYKLNSSEEHWTIVRGCTLDDLLFKMFSNYRNPKELESLLYRKADSLPDAEEYKQAASAIVKAINRFYGKK